ncbi:uncharacterized protein LOC141544672 isoform X2 [Sminthopsis crassicaudata]|uniref:uncharacterized protein LOC141544672 isoform X2 n=1 Tax=Sminthopsis crassicaudata TaxID=9301 RepID=UPI003D68FAA5
MKKIFNFGKKKGQSPSRPFIKVPSYFGVQTPYPTEGYQIQSKDLGKIHKAALLGDVAKVQQLLLLGKSTVNDLDKMKRTPLHLACANGYPDVVSLLVERKCELNLLDNDNRTPLMKAIECRQEECATILLEHGADPNLRDENNDTILHYVASSRTKFMAEILIKHKIDIEAVNKEGLTPLLLAITTMNTELADFLLKNGANVNALDSYKRTALMIAVSVEALGLVTLLLQNNADYTLQDISGWTAQTYAERYGYPLHIYHKQIEKQKEHIAQEREQFEKEKLCLPQIICSEKPSDSEFALCAPSLDKKAEGSSAKDSVSSLSDKPGSDDHLPSTENELDFDMKCSHENLLEISAKHKVVSTNQNAKDSVSLGQHEDHPGKIPSAKPIQSLCEIKDTFTNQEVEGLKEIEPKLDFIEEFDLRDTDDVDDLKQKLEYKGSSVRIQENFDKRDQEQRSHENFLEISARRVLVSANQNIKDSISLRQHEDHLRRNSNGKPIQPSLQMKDSFTNQEIGKRDTSKWDSTSTSQIKESHKSSKDMMLQSNYSVKSLPLGQNQLSSTRFAKIPAIKGEAVLGIGPVIDYKVGVQLEKPVLQKECSKDMKLQNDFPGKSLPLSHNQLPSTKVEKIPTVKGEAVVGIGPVIDYKVGIQLIKPVRQKECSKDMKLQSNYPGKSLPLSQNQLPSPKSENIPSQEDENAAAGSEPIIDYKEGDHLEKTVPQKQCESFLDKEKWKEVKKDLKQELKFKGPSELSEASSALANNLSDSVEKEKDKDSLSVGDLQSFPGERVDIPENVFFQNLKINFPKNVFQFSSNMCSKRSTPQSKNKPKIEHTCNVNEDNIGYVAKNIKRAGSKLGINEIKEDRSFGIEMTFSQHKNITNLESDSGGLLQSSGPGSHFGGQLTHSGDIASINQEKIPELITARKHKEKTKHTETSFQNSHHNATNSTNELRHGRHSLPHEDQISKMHLDKELKQDKQILTNELGMLQAESLTLEKEKIQPQKKMEEKRQKHQQKQMETLERKDGDKLAGKANEQFSTESHQHGNDEENKIPGEEIPIMSISSEEKLTPVHHILKGNWREKLIQKHRRNCYSLGKFEEKEIKIGKNVKKSEDENCISKDSSTTSENVNSSSSSIFDNRDDSTLNETDPDELRLTKNILNEKNKDKVEMATDAFDDFTQSQDTGTEDYDLLPSHYVQGSPCLQEDQNTVLASDLSVKVKKSQWKKLPGKIKSLEKAIRELQKKFSERSKTESQLEHQKVECDRELYRDRIQ